MKKIKKITIILLIFCLVLTGCKNLTTKSSNSNQPKFSDEFEKISETLARTTYSKSNLTLIHPKNGAHQLAINKFTDKLNRTFAVTFYEFKFKKDSPIKNLRLSILKKDEKNNWHQILNTPMAFEDVDKIMFLQNKNSNNAFLIIGYCHQHYGFESNSHKKHLKLFQIYELDPDNPKLLELDDKNFKNNCYSYLTMNAFDLDNSNESKLLLLYKTPGSFYNNGGFNLSILNLKPDKIELENNFETNINMFPVNYCEMKLDNKSFDDPAIFLDLKNDYVTKNQIFLIKKANGSFNFEKIYETNNSYDSKIFSDLSFDFDNDDHIEIPIIEPFPGCKFMNNVYDINKPKNKKSNKTNHTNMYKLISSNISQKKISAPHITNWTKFSLQNNQIKKTIFPTYTNFNKGYGFHIPKTWQEKVTARYANKNKTIEFFEYENNKNSFKNKILTITTCLASDEIPPDFFVVKTNGPFMFIAKIQNPENLKEKNLFIFEDELKQSFFILKKRSDKN